MYADLHTHSCLSPCGSLEMSPRRIAAECRRLGLGMVALCDHNSTRNHPAFAAACTHEGVVPLFGVEACSSEEVHLLCLFAEMDAAAAVGLVLETHLQPIPLDPHTMGDQAAVDENEMLIESPELFLAGATDLGMAEIGRLTADHGGLFIPAHVDRSSFSVWSQLGFLPEGPYDAVEVTRPEPRLDVSGLPWIASSDAHYPADIGRRCILASLQHVCFRNLRRHLHDVQPVFDSIR